MTLGDNYPNEWPRNRVRKRPEPVYRKYFVSYAYRWEDMDGFGVMALNRSRPVTGLDDIKALVEAAKKQPGLRDAEITILNWRRFENEE